MDQDNAKFVAQAVKEGVQDIVASYSAAIDKFVADPDVRIAIKMAAGAGVMQRIFTRVNNLGKPADEGGNKEASEEAGPDVDPHSFPTGLLNWPDERF